MYSLLLIPSISNPYASFDDDILIKMLSKLIVYPLGDEK